MAFVHINPRYRDVLERHGLSAPEAFLALPGVIISGHPDRNVAKVSLGPLQAFLKREHRVRWRHRLANAWAGFGFISRSVRESATLEGLHKTGVGCPRWMAAGEDNQGRAFVLIEELGDVLDLRLFLASGRDRWRVAHRLGIALARMHAAGFNHPDLYAKHVLVDPDDEAIYFIDWQRSRPARALTWQQRRQDLAALDATLAEELATPRERLTCLRSYFAAAAEAGQETPWAELLPRIEKFLAREVRRAARRLLSKRHVREVRESLQPLGRQGVLWLDGEGCCISRDFWDELQGKIPDWLVERKTRWLNGTTRTEVALPGGRRGLYVGRQRFQPLRWLWSALGGRTLVSPEVREAGALFRRQREGMAAPRLLAFGQQHSRPWCTESFLLTELSAPEGETCR